MSTGHALREGESVIGYLTTAGRVTGEPHKVALRLVHYRGRLYASRRDAVSDWCKNLTKNPAVTVHVRDAEYHGTAALVDDSETAVKISRLKYQDDRALSPRVIVEIVPVPG